MNLQASRQVRFFVPQRLKARRNYAACSNQTNEAVRLSRYRKYRPGLAITNTSNGVGAQLTTYTNLGELPLLVGIRMYRLKVCHVSWRTVVFALTPVLLLPLPLANSSSVSEFISLHLLLIARVRQIAASK